MMPKPVDTEMLAPVIELLRDQIVHLKDLQLSEMALVEALAERDGTFLDRYFARKDALESGPIAERMSATLSSLNQLIAVLKRD